ncbi:MAG: HEPN domain-containing protein [Chloroflexi bacterium]|nr:HEPN domain-containing protein [Chloroflexota bacterium]
MTKKNREAADGLDAVMTSSRYPDAVPFAAVPARHFSESQAEECIEWAQQIVNAVRDLSPNI